jgi:cytochrome P450
MTDPAKDVLHEAEEGRTGRAPLIVLSGVTFLVAGLVAIVVALAFLAYYLSS